MLRCYLFIVLAVCYGVLRPAVEVAVAQEARIQVARLVLSSSSSSDVIRSDATEANPADQFPKPPEPLPHPDLVDMAFDIHQPDFRRELLAGEQPYVTWRIAALSLSSDTTLISEGAFASGPPESFSQSRPLTDWHHRLRLMHERPWEQSYYGIEYQYEGNAKDRDRIEVWGAWDLSAVALKTSVARLEDNVGKAPYRPRITTLRSQIAMDIAVTNWSRIGLSYTRALARSTWEPPGVGALKRQLDTVEVSLVYNRSVWEAMLTSTYAAAQNRVAQATEAIKVYQGVSLAYRLAPELVITPSLNYTREWTRASQIWTTTPSVSLAVTRNQLLKDVDVKATSSYAWRKGPGRVLETRRINATGSVIWHMKRFWWGRALISVNLSYESFRDAITPTNSHEGIAGGLSFQLRFS